MRFSLLFFSQQEREEREERFKLLVEATRFADRAGFEAVWIPERHFDPIGGIYPDPAVVAAALAVQTENVRLRAGSVVLPLHHPAAVVESWSVVDNLSRGRVDLAFASGWNPTDFVLSPNSFADHRREWIDRIRIVKLLWSGEAAPFPDGGGKMVSVKAYPPPVQQRLNVWLAITRKEESFRIAGELGFNVLTMLSGITLDKLSKNVTIYRQARRAAGYDPESGTVTLMLHTFIHPDLNSIRSLVRPALMDYIKSTARVHLGSGAVQLNNAASERDVERMAEYSFERFFKTGGLFGDLEIGRKIVKDVAGAGVDEIASMLDFGLENHVVLEGLTHLRALSDCCRITNQSVAP